MSNISKTRTLPRTLRPSTVDRMDAIARGIKRKHIKLTHKASKAHPKRTVFATPTDKDCFIVRKYARNLTRFE